MPMTKNEHNRPWELGVFRDEGARVQRRGVRFGLELPSLCPLQAVAAAGTPPFCGGGDPSLCHCPLSPTKKDRPSPDRGSRAWALCLTLGWRMQL